MRKPESRPLRRAGGSLEPWNGKGEQGTENREQRRAALCGALALGAWSLEPELRFDKRHRGEKPESQQEGGEHVVGDEGSRYLSAFTLCVIAWKRSISHRGHDAWG